MNAVTPEPNPPPSNWVKIIEAVREPIAFFTLAILAFILLVSTVSPDKFSSAVWGFLAVVGIFSFIVYFVPEHFYRPKTKNKASQKPKQKFKGDDSATKPPTNQEELFGADRPPPDLDVWYTKLRPTLHQASFYTVPTYYLDTDLFIVDFNIAFELIFQKISGTLRGKHVLAFINILDNVEAVFEHGKKFTNEVNEQGTFPFIDMEPIRFHTDEFGPMEFTKIASQLHDSRGDLQGWAVALMIRTIDWERFEHKLYDRLYKDKLWSVYSGAYDRILNDFPPYQRLIEDVLACLPKAPSHVADLGAGTGNVSAVLDARGYRITAVENNIGMLDRFAQKKLTNIAIVKGSVENLGFLGDNNFNAVVMVNVLYAVDDPLRCLRDVFRVLKPGGILSFSSTHRNTNLDELLEAIKQHLIVNGKSDLLQVDYDTLYRINREIERSIARRFTIEQYKNFVQQAGFAAVLGFTESAYLGAVFVMHVKKPERPSALARKLENSKVSANRSN